MSETYKAGKIIIKSTTYTYIETKYNLRSLSDLRTRVSSCKRTVWQ